MKSATSRTSSRSYTRASAAQALKQKPSTTKLDPKPKTARGKGVPAAFGGKRFAPAAADGAPVPDVKRDGMPTALFYFDREWYAANYPDVAAAGVDPATHFMECGWREGRNPNPHFDCNAYLEANPDVLAAQLNPFVHFIMYGVSERRSLRPEVN
ncbi:hypothetical protein [Acetobacter sp. DsW_063]|uniref:hypothetical protein n=1 Tax=Acetobacter sp. DsW_063 TaxID=1514894 RepID=UPI001E3BE3EA|nr:hypothetical protein [Acetobacter sp. DsW_063]